MKRRYAVFVRHPDAVTDVPEDHLVCTAWTATGARQKRDVMQDMADVVFGFHHEYTAFDRKKGIIL